MLSLLVAHGLDIDVPTFVIWEGNTMYLDAAADRAILDQLRAGLSHVRVSFDYFVPAIITRTTGDPALTRMADNFTAMNAPWVTAFADVARARRARSGSRCSRTSRPARSAASIARCPPPPAFGPFYAIATLGIR